MQFGDNTMSITLFEQQPVRRIWHDGRWFYSVIDVVAVLTESQNPRVYWAVLKKRLMNGGKFAELIDQCLSLKLIAIDGKSRETDCASIDILFQILQKIPFLHRTTSLQQEDGLTECGIYGIINTITGEHYIGSSINIPARYQQHRSELRRGKHHSAKLQAAWEQYGEEAFELIVLEIVVDHSNLAEREQWHLEQEQPVYNMVQWANNAASHTPIEEQRLNKLMLCLMKDAAITFSAPFLQYIQYAIMQGIVAPAGHYDLLFQAEQAQITTWEAFQDFVAQS